MGYQFGLPAVAGRIKAFRQLVLIKGAQPRSFPHGLGGVFMLRLHAVIGLVVGVIHHVVILAASRLAQGVGSGRHGLGLQRLQGEGIAHFIGHHAQ